MLKAFSHSTGTLRFTVRAWSLEQTAPVWKAVYREGGRIYVNPHRLLMEPEMVEAELQELEPACPHETVVAAVSAACARLRAFWMVRSDILGDVISLGGRTRRVPAMSDGIYDYAKAARLKRTDVREILRNLVRCHLANEIAALEPS